MKDPLLEKIREQWPEIVKIGWMKSESLMWPELYVLVEIREDIKFLRNPINYHPVYVIVDGEGETWYYEGLMPG